MLGQDSEDEIWSRFMFEFVIWPQDVTLVRWTQSSGPLCLWQCLISLWSRIGCRVAPILCEYCSSTIFYSRASTVFWSADSVSFPSSSNQLWSAYISVHTRRRLHDLKWDDRVVGWRGSVWWLHCAAHRGGWCLIYYSPPLPTYAIICTTAKWFTFANTYRQF